MYKHWKMPLNYKYFTQSFQHGRYSKKIRKNASLPVVFHRYSLVLSMCPLWSNYRYTLQSDCHTVALFCQRWEKMGKMALQLRAKYLSGHHCVDGKVLVSMTVMRGHMSVFHIIQQIVMRTDEYRMDISKDQENIGHVKDHGLWICHAT